MRSEQEGHSKQHLNWICEVLQNSHTGIAQIQNQAPDENFGNRLS